VNLGKWAPRTQYQDEQAAKAAGFGNPQKEAWERNSMLDNVASYTGKIEDRKRADAAVIAFQNSQGLAGQLKKAEDDLSAMTKPAVGVSSVKDVSAYKSAEAHVEAIKNEIAAAKKGGEELAAF
jgi:hypothetical protein